MTTGTDYPLPPIALPSGVARSIELLWRTVALALMGFLARYGAPAHARRQIYCEGNTLSLTIAVMRRVQKIVRYLIVVYARHFMQGAVFAERKTAPVRDRVHRPEIADDPSTWRAHFIVPKYRSVFVRETNGMRPEGFLRANADLMLVIARKMEGLRRVLAQPMPYVKRLARQLRRGRFFIPWREPPRRKPKADYRRYWAEFWEARHQAWWALTPQNPYLDSS